jgi:hypothetical protein
MKYSNDVDETSYLGFFKVGAVSFFKAFFLSAITAGVVQAYVVKGLLEAFLGLLSAATLWYVWRNFVSGWFDFGSSSGNTQTVMRGAAITNKRKGTYNKIKDDDLRLRIGSVPIPAEAEALSFIFSGSPGSGKSQAINGMIRTLRRRKEVGIVADAGGGAMARFFEPGDFIFNVFDTRSVKWSLFAEMEKPQDAAMLAASIIPCSDENDKEKWFFFSQQLVASVILRLWETGRGTNKQFLYYLTIAKQDELESLVAGLPAQKQFEPGASRMLASMTGIIAAHLLPFTYLDPDAGEESFSIRAWFLETRSAGYAGSWLWLPYREDMIKTIRGLIATAIDLVATTALSQDEDRNATMAYIIVDELPAIGLIPSLRTLLKQGRKYRFASIAGFQCKSDVEEIYGQYGMKSLSSCYQTMCILRTVDADTSDYLSKTLGDHEIERESQSTSRTSGGENNTSSTSWRTDRKIQRVILPSEIQNLPTRVGYLSIAGQNDIGIVEIPIVDVEPVIKTFEEKDYVKRNDNPAQPVLISAETRQPRQPRGSAPAAIKIDIE